MKTMSSKTSPTARVARALLTLPLAVGALAADNDAAKPEAKPEEKTTEKAAAQPAEATAASETPSDLKNWVEFGVGGTFLEGNKAAAQRRSGLPDGAFGGIEGFHYEQGVAKEGFFKDATLKADGRGIFDNHDYQVDLDLTVPDKGYLRGGFREFRSYYDPSGGYFPPSQSWVSPYSDALFVDRRAFYVEAGLRLPDLPKFTLRYEHDEQEGQKDSTIWGETSQTGGYGTRSIVPTVLDLDRVRDLVMADLAHTFGETKVNLGVRYERQNNDDGRFMLRYPGEGPGAQAYTTQRDQVESDLFNVHASSASKLNSKLTLTAGYAYTDLNADTSGYRLYGTGFDPDFAQRLGAPYTYENLVGGSLMSQHVGNLNLMTTLSDKLVIVPSVRVEGSDTRGASVFDAPAAPFTSSLYSAHDERGLLDVSEGLDARYTGVTNWVFYARGYWLQGSGDLSETRQNLSTSTDVLARATDDKRYTQKYTAGANWYPLRKVSLGAEYYHKIRDNDYNHTQDSTSNLPGSPNTYPAFLTAQNFTTDDVNFRVTWRPRVNVTLVGRYDLQLSTIDTQPDGLSKVESSDMTSHIGSGSVSWVPFARMYLQGNLSYVWDRTETPASDLTAAVLDSENNYWTANATLGYALDDKTDAELQYLYYRADNYEDNAAYSQPYGAGAEEQGVTAGLVRQMTKRIRMSLKYGFFTSHDQLSGGNRDFNSHLVYSTLQYRF